MAITQHRVYEAEGQLTVAQVNAGACVVAPIVGKKFTVMDFWLRAIGGNTGAATLVAITDGYLHHTTDATTIAATIPAVSEPESYALSIELIADHNTHTAAVAYHRQATAAVTSTAATTEATLIAQVNKMRTAQLAHYSDYAAHGGIPDATRYALVAATTVATTAATAIVLENLLAAYHAAHITVTTALNTILGSAARAGLTSAAVLRAGASNTTATNVGMTAGTVGRGLWIVKTGVDATTATHFDYHLAYIAESS